MKEEFKELYFKCFNEDGSTKLCGRSACSNLIDLCEQMSGVDCGDALSGKMNIAVIKDLAKKEGII